MGFQDVRDESKIGSIPGTVSTGNSTTTLLGNGEVFTGSWTDVKNYAEIAIGIYSDKASATNGVDVQWSNDGTTIHDHDYSTLAASIGDGRTYNPMFRYFRLVYTNGTQAQTAFSIVTTLKPIATKGSSHRIADTLRDQNDGSLHLSVLKLRTAADTYVSGAATNSGNFKVSLEETNSYEPTKYEHKQVTVGLTQVEITFTDTTKQILIQADHSNTGSIWLGTTGVTTSTGAPRLMAGEAVEISYNDGTNALYAISDVAAQKINISATTE